MIVQQILLEEQKNQLAKFIQKGFPIAEKPYHELANHLNVDYKTIMNQIEEWYSLKSLREISAIMEGEVLGYESALVCGTINEQDLDHVVNILKEHPTITHLYLRNYSINLWFTISVPRNTGIEQHLQVLTNLTGYTFYALKRTQTFKIGVNFDLFKRINQTEKQKLPSKIQSYPEEELTENVKQTIRAIQTPLPLAERPFQTLAKQYDLEENEIINFLIKSPYGCIRKYVATFNHRNLGVSYNAMTVWAVPEHLLGYIGNQLAEFPEVSHCYARTTIPSFPYNLYSMIHGPDEKTVKHIVQNISQRLNIQDFLILYSPKEYKKTRLKYFLKELEDWTKLYFYR